MTQLTRQYLESMQEPDPEQVEPTPEGWKGERITSDGNKSSIRVFTRSKEEMERFDTQDTPFFLIAAEGYDVVAVDLSEKELASLINDLTTAYWKNKEA